MSCRIRSSRRNEALDALRADALTGAAVLRSGRHVLAHCTRQWRSTHFSYRSGSAWPGSYFDFSASYAGWL